MGHNPEKFEIKEEIYHLEYSYKDTYGRFLTSEKSDKLELLEIPLGASEFDGYVETPVGSFAFQGEIGKARKFLKDVQEYNELLLQTQNIQAKLSVKKLEQNHYGPRAKDNFAKWSEIGGKIGVLEENLRVLNLRLVGLKKALELYKL